MLIKTFTVYIPTIMWEMKVSTIKVLTDNEKRCITLLNRGVGVKNKEAGGLNKY